MLSFDVAQGVDAGMFVRDYRASRSMEVSAGPTSATWRRSRAVVYLHDLGEQGLGFEPVVLHPELSRYRQVVPDLPGHGRSKPAARPTPLEAFADHFARWLSSRTGAGVMLVGHGFGGVLAMLIGERHPDLVRAVVDIAGPKCLDDCARLRATLGKHLADASARGFARSYDARLFQAWGHELCALAADGALASRLGALSIPALFVTGSRGGVSPRSLELLSNAHVVVAEMPDTGARPLLERPDELVSILSDFLGCHAADPS
jgi:pimeloyl-ACP methyl ester carboxylesterase